MDTNNLKVLAVIPARGGSKGIPKKNIKLLCSKPLIYYMIEAAKKCEYIDRVVLSTEDEKIAEIAKEMGAEVPFLRPAELARDDTPLNPVLKHAMEFYDAQGWRADVIVSLQPTSPLITSDIISLVIKKYIDTNCDSVVTVTEIRHGHPYRAKRLADGDKVENFFPNFDGDRFFNRQERPPAYAYNGAIYLRKRDLVENWDGVDFGLGNDCRAVIVEPEYAVNIDDEFDFKLAEILLREREHEDNSV